MMIRDIQLAEIETVPLYKHQAQNRIVDVIIRLGILDIAQRGRFAAQGLIELRRIIRQPIIQRVGIKAFQVSLDELPIDLYFQRFAQNDAANSAVPCAL